MLKHRVADVCAESIGASRVRLRSSRATVGRPDWLSGLRWACVVVGLVLAFLAVEGDAMACAATTDDVSGWWRHRWLIGAGAAILVIQPLLLGAYLIQRLRRRQAESAECRATSTVSAVFRTLRERVAVLDRDGRVVSVNQAWADANPGFGRVAVGANYLEFVREEVARGREDLAGLAEATAAILAGERRESRLDFAERDGAGERVFEALLAGLDIAGGGAVIAIDDVSEQRRSERRFRAVVEAVPVAILVVDRSGTILQVNSECERLFGWQREELIGQPLELLTPESRSFVYRQLRAGFASGLEGSQASESSDVETERMGREELVGRRKDGSEVPIDAALKPFDTEGGPVMLVSVVDLTERQRQEREREHRLAETAHWARLAVVGELTAAIAHEINQPLTGIMTNVEAALRFIQGPSPPTTDEIAEVLADIAADGRRASEVIRRLRALLRKGPLEFEPTDPNQLVRQVSLVVTNDLLLRGVDLDLELAPNLPPVLGDRVQLQQVLLNLILNGVDAMADAPRERRRILVRTAPAAGRLVRFEIRDAGPGISEEVKARLFEPFFTTKSGGLGMGLSIVRSIVQSHGGSVSASSNSTGGACFTVELPAVAIPGGEET
jgi:two-component system sensor kinase FixL